MHNLQLAVNHHAAPGFIPGPAEYGDHFNRDDLEQHVVAIWQAVQDVANDDGTSGWRRHFPYID